MCEENLPSIWPPVFSFEYLVKERRRRSIQPPNSIHRGWYSSSSTALHTSIFEKWMNPETEMPIHLRQKSYFLLTECYIDLEARRPAYFLGLSTVHTSVTMNITHTCIFPLNMDFMALICDRTCICKQQTILTNPVSPTKGWIDPFHDQQFLWWFVASLALLVVPYYRF